MSGARLVADWPHQPAVANHIGCEDCGESEGCANYSGSPAIRKPSVSRAA